MCGSELLDGAGKEKEKKFLISCRDPFSEVGGVQFGKSQDPLLSLQTRRRQKRDPFFRGFTCTAEEIFTTCPHVVSRKSNMEGKILKWKKELQKDDNKIFRLRC